MKSAGNHRQSPEIPQLIFSKWDGVDRCYLASRSDYSNRGRISVAPAEDNEAASPSANHGEQNISDCSREARSTWARLIKKIFEADPLLCPCGGRMRIVSFITDPRVVDCILRHSKSGRCKTRDPFEPRPPPGASAKIPQ